MKRRLIFGGTGHMGLAIKRHLDPARYQITIVTRNPKSPGDQQWDGRNLGAWTEALDGCDVGSQFQLPEFDPAVRDLVSKMR